MPENRASIQIESRILNLEMQTGYKIYEESPEKWRSIVNASPPDSLVDWDSTSGHQDSHLKHTSGAAICFAGVTFKKREGILVPNLFHFFPVYRSYDKLRNELDILPGEQVIGIVGSMEKSFYSRFSKLYTQDFGLIPIMAPPPNLFNVFVSPQSKQIVYCFD